MSGSVYINLAPISVSAQTPSLLEGQPQGNVVIGTLADSAGVNSVAGYFSATYSTQSGQNYAVTLVPDSPNDGNYNLTVNLPGLPTNTPPGTLYVVEADGSQTNGVSVGVSLNVSPYNTLNVTEQDATIQYKQPGAVTVGVYSDSLGVDPSNYFGSVSFVNGPTYSVSFSNGQVQIPDLSSLAPGSYTGTLTVADASAGAATCTVLLDVQDATPSAIAVATINGTEDEQWSGQIATFAASNQYILSIDYTATISYGDGTASQTGTITGGNGAFTVTDSHNYLAVDASAISVTVTENAGSDPATDSASGAGSAVIAPLAPANLAVGQTDANRVVLSWSNDSYGATSFYIMRLDPGSDSYAIIDNVPATPGNNTYSDWSVASNADGSGGTYNYLVLAASPDGNVSTMSNVVTATTPTAGVTDLTATELSTTAITLNWTPEDTTAPVEVWRSTDGVNYAQLTLPMSPTIPTSFSDTGLTPGTQYWYQVRGNDPNNSNGPTGYTVVTAYTLPTAPSGLTATPNADQTVGLAWTNNSGSSTIFEIQRADSGSTDFETIDETDPGASSYTDDAVDPSASYQYQVLADSGDGAGSSASNVAVFLGQPTDLTATAVSASEIDLAWTSDPTTGVNILRSTSGDPGSFTQHDSISGTNDGTYNDTSNLSPGTPYYYEVQAMDGTNTSAPSDPANDTTVPAAPTISAVTVVSTSELDVSWGAVTGALGYDVQRMAEGGSWQTITQIESGGTTTYQDTGLSDATTYSYRVDAFNNAGTSAASASASQTTRVLAPSMVQAIALSPSAIQIVWQDNSSNETGFYAYRSEDGVTWQKITAGGVGAGTTTYTDTDSTLSASSGYQYEVTAYKTIAGGVEESPYSSPTAAVTIDEGVPAAPVNLQMSSDGTTLTFDPGDNSNDATFSLERSRGGGNFAQVGGNPGFSNSHYYFICPAMVYGESYTYEVIAQGPGGNTASAPISYTMPVTAPPQSFDGGGEFAPDNQTYTIHVDWWSGIFNAGDAPLGFKAYFYRLDVNGNVIDPSTPDAAITGTPTSPGGLDAWASIDMGGLAIGSHYKIHVELYNAVNAASPQFPDSGNSGFYAGPPSYGYGDTNSLTATQHGPNGWDLAWPPGEPMGLQYSVDGVNWWQGGSGPTQWIAPGAAVYLRSWSWPGPNTQQNPIAYTDPVYIYGPALAAPTGLSAVASNDSGPPQVTLRWGAVPDLSQSDIDIGLQYIEIDRSGDGGNTFLQIAQRPDNNPLPDGTIGVVDSPPSENTTYIYRIRRVVDDEALHVYGYSPYSDPASATTLPNRPANVNLYAQTPTEAVVMWTDTSDGEAVTNVEIATDADFTNIIATGSAGADVRNCLCTLIGDNILTPSGSYYIRAENVSGAGLHSGWSALGGGGIQFPTITTLLNASETAPDGTPGDGYFEIDRPSYGPINFQQLNVFPAITVNYTIDQSAANAAVPGKDYQPLSGSVSFPAGAMSEIVAVAPELGEFAAGVTTVTAVVAASSGTLPSSPPPPSATVSITSQNAVTPYLDYANYYGLQDPYSKNAQDFETEGNSGKIISVNDSDRNGNGIPDYADGYGKFSANYVGEFANVPLPAPKNQVTLAQGGGFVPVEFKISKGVPLGGLAFRFTYSASDPTKVSVDGSGTLISPYTYTPPTAGQLRLWTKDEPSLRNPKGADNGGDFIPSGTALSLEDLGSAFDSATGLVKLYIEAIKPSANLRDGAITLQIDPSGSGTFANPIACTVTTTEVDTKVLIGATDAAHATVRTDWVGAPDTSASQKNVIYNWITVTGPQGVSFLMTVGAAPTVGIAVPGVAGGSVWLLSSTLTVFGASTTMGISIGAGGMASVAFCIAGVTVSNAVDDVAVSTSISSGVNGLPLGVQTLTVLKFNYAQDIGTEMKPLDAVPGANPMTTGNYIVNPSVRSNASDTFAFDAGANISNNDPPAHDGSLFTGTTPALDYQKNIYTLPLPMSRKFDVQTIAVSYLRQVTAPGGIPSPQTDTLTTDPTQQNPGNTDLSISPAGMNGGRVQSNLRIQDSNVVWSGIGGAKYVYYLAPVTAAIVPTNTLTGFTGGTIGDSAHVQSVSTASLSTYNVALHILSYAPAGALPQSLGFTPADVTEIEAELNRIYGQVGVNFSFSTPAETPLTDIDLWNLPNDENKTLGKVTSLGTKVPNAINVWLTHLIGAAKDVITGSSLLRDRNGRFLNKGSVIGAASQLTEAAQAVDGHDDISFLARNIAHEIFHDLTNLSNSGHSEKTWSLFYATLQGNDSDIPLVSAPAGDNPGKDQFIPLGTEGI